MELELSVQTLVFLFNPWLRRALHRSLGDNSITSSSVSNHELNMLSVHILTTCCVSKVCDEWMWVWQRHGLHSVCGTKSNTVMSEERHNWTTTLSETAHIMPWCSPLKQGIMLQNNYIGGWNDLVWSPHLVIIIIIIIIICLYILFTDSKTPCCSFS